MTETIIPVEQIRINGQSEKPEVQLPITELDLFRRGFVSIHIMGTEWCNLKCPHCYAPYAAKSGMEPENIKRIVKQIEQSGMEKYWYDLSGGEIMGNRHWPQIFDILLSTGKDISVNTNGTLINERTVQVLKKLDERYPNKLFLSVSLDSHDPEVNELTRPGEASRNVYKAMELLKENNIRFRAALTLTGRNVNTMVDTVRFVVNNYTREFIIGVIRPVFTMNDANKDIVIPLLTVQQVMTNVLELKSELGDFEMYHCLDAQGATFCEAGRDRIAIKENGDVTACYALQSDSDVVGNIFQEDFRLIASRLHAIHTDRDRSVLLCEHQTQIWGKPPHRLGSENSGPADVYLDKMREIKNPI